MLRHCYRFLLRLHPRYFRVRFAGQMLADFDDAAAERRPLPLFADAFSSLVRQRFFRSAPPAQPAPEAAPMFFTFEPYHPRRGALANGGFLSLMILCAVIFAIGHSGANRRLEPLRIGAYHPRPHVLPVDRASVQEGGLSTEVQFAKERPNPMEALARAYFNGLPVLTILDADQDRILSVWELATAPAALHRLDRNGDGVLTAEECGFRLAEEMKVAPPSSEDVTRSLLAFDRNGDGILQRTELPAARVGFFTRADANGDGALTITEIRTMTMQQQAWRKEITSDAGFLPRARLGFMRFHPVHAALDHDHDGTLSATEIANSTAALKELDRNHDDSLDASELLPSAAANQAAVILANVDRNGDGKISPEERDTFEGRRLRLLLDRADSNFDGLIDTAELAHRLRLEAEANRQLEKARRTR